uniref:Uncharacterized protein n=1 Tax=Panagrolaimus davidi TaxID=227884 RepID=A0A914PMI6_9BILA
MNGKFAQSLEANHALAQQANDNIKKFTEQQNNIKNQINELENAMSKKHAAAIEQIDEVRNQNHQTQKDLQDLSANMLSSFRVKRQVQEFHSGTLTPQRENGDFN